MNPPPIITTAKLKALTLWLMSLSAAEQEKRK
jgi:hypothetical protein